MPATRSNYTLIASNAGNVTLHGVTVTDPKLGTLACTPPQPATLAPGEQMVCTASYTLTQADVNSGHVDNIGTADSDLTSPTQTPETVALPPALALLKRVTESSFSQVGSVLHYTYLVVNVGGTSLAGPVTVTDDKATVLCPSLTTVGNGDAFLDPHEQVTCTASYTVTQADLNAGNVTNHATATVGGATSNQSTVTVPSAQQPGPTPPQPATPSPSPTIDLQIQKTGRPNPVNVGGTLTYTLVGRNNGPSTATNVVIADSLPPGVRYLSSSSTQGTCSASGQLVNCAIGTMPVGGTVTVTIRVRPLQRGTTLNVAVIVGAEAETSPANNRDEEPTQVRSRSGLLPGVVIEACPNLNVSTKTLKVGKRSTIKAIVTRRNKRVPGVRVLAHGAGILKSGVSDKQGVVRISVKPPKVGIVQLRITGQRRVCGARRIGVIGIFKPAPVTG